MTKPNWKDINVGDVVLVALKTVMITDTESGFRALKNEDTGCLIFHGQYDRVFGAQKVKMDEPLEIGSCIVATVEDDFGRQSQILLVRVPVSHPTDLCWMDSHDDRYDYDDDALTNVRLATDEEKAKGEVIE